MSRELTPERQAAHIATAKSLIFDTLEHTKAMPEARTINVEVSVAVSTTIHTIVAAASEVWTDQPHGLIGLVSVLGNSLIKPEGRPHLGTAVNALSALLGADLITTPLKEQLDRLQGFADAIASLEVNDETDAMLRAMVERARYHSEARPGGFKSETPLNDVFRRGQEDYPFSAEVPGHEAPEGGEA